MNLSFPFAQHDSASETAAKTARADAIEPGLLSAYRVFIGFQLFVVVIGTIVARLRVPEIDAQAVIYWSLWMLAWNIGLFAYLSYVPWQHRLGKFYLPVALVMSTAIPIFQRVLFVYLNPELEAMGQVEIAGWRVLVLLLVPLVITAWQYDFDTVLIFSVGTSLLNSILVFIFFGAKSDHWADLLELSATGMVTFVMVGYVITRLVEGQHERQAALIRANEQLVDHAATVEQLAVSRERNRLARDMHDTLAHTLSAVAVQLEAVDSAWVHSPDQAHRLLVKSLDTARSGLAETRRALRALRASPLEDLGLALAIHHLAESTAARNGMELDLDLPNEFSLPPEIEQNVYRIAQEALSNVVNHANATRLSVSMARAAGRIELTIHDDGVGFDPDTVIRESHYGIQGMVERSEMIGADLSVESHPRKGTTIRLGLNRAGGPE